MIVVWTELPAGKHLAFPTPLALQSRFLSAGRLSTALQLSPCALRILGSPWSRGTCNCSSSFEESFCHWLTLCAFESRFTHEYNHLVFTAVILSSHWTRALDSVKFDLVPCHWDPSVALYGSSFVEVLIRIYWRCTSVSHHSWIEGSQDLFVSYFFFKTISDFRVLDFIRRHNSQKCKAAISRHERLQLCILPLRSPNKM